MILRTVVYLFVVAVLMAYEQNPEQFELQLLRKRINGYRRVAECAGRRVITLEGKYATAVESGRMN